MHIVDCDVSAWNKRLDVNVSGSDPWAEYRTFVRENQCSGHLAPFQIRVCVCVCVRACVRACVYVTIVWICTMVYVSTYL